MSTASSKQKYTQLKEWLLTFKPTSKTTTKPPKRRSYDKR